MSEPIKAGDRISVNYTGRFENGEIFDSSEGKEPLNFTVGAGQLIKGFDDAVIGMTVGEKKQVTLAPEEGYGTRREDRIIDMPKENIPADMKLEAGMMVQLMDRNNNPIPAVVHEICEAVVRIDVNHPLAGKTLIFDIEVVETGM
ncbi:MAG: peptidylprolyl isomerase [Deltaproteobacteria bacterium]|nr:peptidylprolyl isomerase [Deltaproteobacteria bacterium]